MKPSEPTPEYGAPDVGLPTVRAAMTLRVSHDSGKTYGPVTEVPGGRPLFGNPGTYPPCECPQHRTHNAAEEELVAEALQRGHYQAQVCVRNGRWILEVQDQDQPAEAPFDGRVPVVRDLGPEDEPFAPASSDGCPVTPATTEPSEEASA